MLQRGASASVSSANLPNSSGDPVDNSHAFSAQLPGGWSGAAEAKGRAYGQGSGAAAATPEQQEDARLREKERQDALRRLEESERRDAARRAGLPVERSPVGLPVEKSPAGLPAERRPAPAAATPARAAAEDGLRAGGRITLGGLVTRPELNGVSGTLVQPVDGKWQVRCDGDLGDKLMKAKNIFPVDEAPASGARTFSWKQRDAVPGKAAPPPAADPSAALAAHLAAKDGATPTFQPAARHAARKASSWEAKGPPPKSEKAKQVLPQQQFRVAHEWANVRLVPSLDAPLVSRESRGSFVTAQEETFDGWVRLADESGWIIKDAARLGLSCPLRLPCQAKLLLAN